MNREGTYGPQETGYLHKEQERKDRDFDHNMMVTQWLLKWDEDAKGLSQRRKAVLAGYRFLIEITALYLDDDATLRLLLPIVFKIISIIEENGQ